MNIVYTDRARQRRDEFSLLQQASQLLPEIVGASAPFVTGVWDRSEEKNGQSVYTLNLKDSNSNDEASESFDLYELQSPEGRELGMLHTWGKVLQAGTHRLLRVIAGE